MSEPWDPFSVFAYDQGQSSSAPQLPDEEPDPSDPERYKAYNLAMKAQTDERLERLKDIKKSPLYPVKKRDNEVSVPKPPMEVPESASEVIVYQAPFLRQEKFRQNMIERHERFEAAIREIPYGDLYVYSGNPSLCLEPASYSRFVLQNTNR